MAEGIRWYPAAHDSAPLRWAGRQMRRDSEAWFPELHARDDGHQLVAHYGLGLAGETGELVNLVKKLNRDGMVDEARIGDELADVFTYLLLLADAFDVDLLAAWRAKRLTNIARWGDPDPPRHVCHPGSPGSNGCTAGGECTTPT